MCAYDGGVLTAVTNVAGDPTDNAIIWSPNGTNLGDPNQKRYQGISPVTAMCAYKGGVLTAFANVANKATHHAIYWSPNRNNLGSPSQTRYQGISPVTAMCAYKDGMLAAFFTPVAPEQKETTGKVQPDGRIELGWMNITPCSKVEWVATSIPGLSLPTLYTGEQRLHVFARVQAFKASIDDILKCAVAAAGTCLIVSVLVTPAGCAEAFQAALSACLKAKIANAVVNSVEISVETECKW